MCLVRPLHSFLFKEYKNRFYFRLYLKGENKKLLHLNVKQFNLLWALTDSNRRPSACKADALNQLS